MIRLGLALALVASAPAMAGQLEKSVEAGLAQEGIAIDVASLTRTQLTALHLELTGQTDPGEGDVRRRDVLRAILELEPTE